ncbi:phosphoglycerate dehydrogenase [Archaeoglobus profundus]|uniref:D-3-phosphoglycerate dehydrogenase n=1 Tax=Archaeoglobus profundus (strain DSM 5631 / JCM 9629 / NBRC 100127 / Av18) TaxID=572546 RepID=D2RHI0_ARCPA|nr:phosphoglycerate dehydrogenase [Archaeoglobus profundus]ADB57755.1 D-3-phosphoglycerate dehydrogenase [Archaeoglobus profundus DSM 5631]
MKVLVADPIAEEAIDFMKKNGLEVDVKTDISHEELLEVIQDYDALIVRSRTRVTRDVIDRAKKLKIIGRAGVGVDNIDVDYATEKGIVVVNAPGGNSVSAAEHTIGLILSIARKIPQADRSVKEGKWERKKFVGIELRGKTLGIVGLGRIGYEVAKRMRCFEMNILAYDPYVSEERAKSVGAKLVSLEELLRNSDIITIHVPKTKETEKMISYKEFEIMKDGVYIINAARGGIVDEKALYDALVSGKVAGAALDVYEKEPPDKDNPLLKLENVVTTPHIGASTREAQMMVGMTVAEDIVNFFKGLPVKNAVNLPSIAPEDYNFLMPFVELAEKIGKIACARLNGVFNKVKITFRGEIAKRNTEIVTRALLKGLLSQILSGVNIVSAPIVAKERGIVVEQSKIEESHVYPSTIEVTVSNGKEIYIEGTCVGEECRILRIDKYKVDFVPKGHYVISLHEDKPGVIGRVGTLMGKYNINIAGMIVGRYGDKPGGIQLMLLLLDDPPTEEILKKMVELEGIIDATYVYL